MGVQVSPTALQGKINIKQLNKLIICMFTIIQISIKNFLTIYLGFLYLFFGIIFLLMPLIYIELGRPRDFIKGGFNLVIGMLLIYKQNSFDSLYSSILTVITSLLTFYLVEIFSIRWNQLTNQEKNKLQTLEELKKNLSIFLKAISLARQDFLNSNNILKFGRKNENLNKKKWVRNDENDNINNSNKNNLLTLEMQKKATNQSTKDTINEGK